ncbi:MAG: bifunctional demethylmenaquinone methyltransferase/2-methoxy-6-polyprenyl-1,4-benzoquinol methylase UbiE [Chlamydiae bacterium]|nr:bifunctional demethylmenaquinone methyltransferase/2-methoxy-6-polyprenyl-1,4-benzoquinol methylase UbiE [Chlamydiota bacterium]
MKNFKSRFGKETVGEMFNKIAPNYDVLNRIFSFGIDLYWRKKMAKMMTPPSEYLDIACGTGDQILAVYKRHHPTLAKIVGVDIAENMLGFAKTKVPKEVILMHENALNLPFSSSSFDAITISFGIRNLPDLSIALQEMKRVLKPGGKLYILEFSLPKNTLIRAFHLFYLRHVIPVLGRWLSKDQKAYRYLNETIEEFPYGKALCDLLKEEGFVLPHYVPLTFGIANVYISSTVLV